MYIAEISIDQKINKQLKTMIPSGCKNIAGIWAYQRMKNAPNTSELGR